MNNENLISIQEFCQIYEVEIIFLDQLSESGLIEIVQFDQGSFIIRDQIPELEKYIVFHKDLDINLAGIEVIQYLLPKMEAQEKEIRELKSIIQFYKNWAPRPHIDWNENE